MWVSTVVVVLVAIWFWAAGLTAYYWWGSRHHGRCQCGMFDVDDIRAEGAESVIHEKWRCYPARELIIDPEKAL